MKISLPAAPPTPAPELPKTGFGRVLASTPVVMTVVATLMAGMSNSEMIRGQYDRSMASQLQAKVGDQWSFYQAKRLRSSSLRASQLVLTATTETSALEGARLQSLASPGDSDTNSALALTALTSSQIPPFTRSPTAGPAGTEIASALAAVAEGKTDTELLPFLARVPPDQLDLALHAAESDSREADHLMSSLASGLDRFERQIRERESRQSSEAHRLWRDFTSARLLLETQRYDLESKWIRPVADLLELKVRLSNRDADRHRARSERFFLGMLAAQLAVIIATFALAFQRRNLVWGVAAALGLAAISFGVYVYLYT